MRERILQIVPADGRTFAVYAKSAVDRTRPHKGPSWVAERVVVWGLIERRGYTPDPDDLTDDGSDRFVDGVDPGDHDCGRMSEHAGFVAYASKEDVDAGASWLEKGARAVLERRSNP